MARILILGGSYLQSDCIYTALRLNHDVHVLDMDKHCFASSIDNITFCDININDEKAVEKYFLETKSDIIIAPVTEIGNKTACIIADRLGLKYNSPQTLRATTDKHFMRECLKNCSFLNEPRNMIFTSIEDVESHIEYPLIVKPSCSSAGRGVTLVHNKEMFKSALAACLIYAQDYSNVLIEEFIDGIQYSIETITFAKGQHYVLALTKELMSQAPLCLERMHIISKEENIRFEHLIKEFVNELLDELNIVVGACHIEIKIKDDKISLIEIASRSGGWRDRLIKYACGSDLNELLINSYLTTTVTSDSIFIPQSNACVGIISYPQDFNIYLEFKKHNLIAEEYFYNKGLTVEPKQLTDAVGYFFCAIPDISILESIIINL